MANTCYLSFLNIKKFGKIWFGWRRKTLLNITFGKDKGDAEKYLKNIGLKPIFVKKFPFKDDFLRYFDKKSKKIHLFYDISRLSTFQKAVLKATANIPYGKVRTYQQLAKKIKNPRACRAVGNALNINPLPILIPCHRVIRSDGSIGGFGSGVQIKTQLLQLEDYLK